MQIEKVKEQMMTKQKEHLYKMERKYKREEQILRIKSTLIDLEATKKIREEFYKQL